MSRRRFLVRLRAKNRFKYFLRGRGIFTHVTGVFNDPEILKAIEKPDDKFIATNLFGHIESISEIKKSYEKKLKNLAKKHVLAKKLCDIPGIIHLRSTIILGIICSGHRFENKHKLWSYAGLIRHGAVSDGKIYGNRKVKGSSEATHFVTKNA